MTPVTVKRPPAARSAAAHSRRTATDATLSCNWEAYNAQYGPPTFSE